MKKIVLAILLIAIGFPVFAKHKKKARPANNIISVSLRHTACYGHCPIYTIEVNKNGTATYTATLFNPDTGVFTKNIGATKAMEIINWVAANKVDTCQDRYESRMTDLPGTVFTIKHVNVTKTIIDATQGPPVLAQLRTMMDGLITRKLDDTWQKIAANPK